MDTYIVLKRFSSLEEAQECHKLLSEKGVTTRLADNVPPRGYYIFWKHGWISI